MVQKNTLTREQATLDTLFKPKNRKMTQEKRSVTTQIKANSARQNTNLSKIALLILDSSVLRCLFSTFFACLQAKIRRIAVMWGNLEPEANRKEPHSC